MHSADLLNYQRVFESAPGLFLVLEPAEPFRIVAASDAYLRATWTSRATIVGFPLFERFFSGTQEPRATIGKQLRASLTCVLATGAPDRMNVVRYDLERPVGEGGGVEERFWSVTNVPVMDADGTIVNIVHRVDDITQQMIGQRTHKELRASEILESITEGFIALNREFRFTYVNAEAERILGRVRDQLHDQVIWEQYPGMLGLEFEHAFRTAMLHEISVTLQAYYPDHDRWYDVRIYPAPSGLSVYFRNVSEERRAANERDQLVSESERQRLIYEAALSNTPDLVYVFDLDHRFVYANEALLAMWGRTREDSLGRTCLELGYEPWHAAMHDREIEHVVATGQAIRGEVPFTGTNGRRIYDYIFVPVFGTDGTVVAVAGTTRDVTDRQQAEMALREQAEQLRESDRAKDEFLATLAHELRNPLAPLRNALSLLRLKADATNDMAPVHEMMERQVDQLVRLVDDLLETARITRGAIALRTERLDIATVVRHAIETSAPAIASAQHTLDVRFADSQIWVDGDAARLSQVLANLLNNAAKYTNNGGRIQLSVSAENRLVAISVRDNGIGISREILPRIFGMFSRGDRASQRAQGGLGIGLALARRLAELHGGSVHAYSEGPAQGSEFIVRLPMSVNQQAGVTHSVAPDTNFATQRILVVDDNRDAADSLSRLLQFLGADTRTAHDGRTALEVFHAFEPSVVLLDIGMPGMNGYDVARAIRSRFPDRDVSIVALTGWGQEADRKLGQEAGFDHHLVKPVDIAALRTLLSEDLSAVTALE